MELEKRFKKENESSGQVNVVTYIGTELLTCKVCRDFQERQKDNEGWIDPSNESAISMASLVEKINNLISKSGSSVGCITLDFAMQNVLTQIGLHVVAPDGRVIKESSSGWHCCVFNIESDMSKLFCRGSGHNTLKLEVTLRGMVP